MTLADIRTRVVWRRDPCRRDGHDWTELADPPACRRCGRAQSVVR